MYFPDVILNILLNERASLFLEYSLHLPHCIPDYLASLISSSLYAVLSSPEFPPRLSTYYSSETKFRDCKE